jgi:hypothetical protein
VRWTSFATATRSDNEERRDLLGRLAPRLSGPSERAPRDARRELLADAPRMTGAHVG